MKLKLNPGNALTKALGVEPDAGNNAYTLETTTQQDSWELKQNGDAIHLITKPVLNEIAAAAKLLGSATPSSVGANVSNEAIAVLGKLNDVLYGKNGAATTSTTAPVPTNTGQMYKAKPAKKVIDEPAEPGPEPDKDETVVEDDASPLKFVYGKKAAPQKESGSSLPGLMKATELGQAVRSTSSGSCYHVVAIGPDLRLAARLRNGQLSVRAEGNLMKYPLGANGLTKSDKGTHSSAHLAVGKDKALARRTLASLIWGIGAPFDKVAVGLSDMEDFGS